MTYSTGEKGVAEESSIYLVCDFICKLSETRRNNSTASSLQAVLI